MVLAVFTTEQSCFDISKTICIVNLFFKLLIYSIISLFIHTKMYWYYDAIFTVGTSV